tara:strand:- start:164 stop:460 length:297 start_codon:yes stop_codon:yes gene_type:complete
MIIFGRKEYGIMFVTLIISMLMRALIDMYVYNISPFSRDIFLEIWQGTFLYDKYWQFIFGFFLPFGYVWGNLCAGHLKAIVNRGEMHKGSLCYRILGF